MIVPTHRRKSIWYSQTTMASKCTSPASSPVIVCVRVRPPLPREIDKEGVFHSCIGIAKNKSEIHVTTTDKPVLIRADGTPDPQAALKAGLKSFNFDKVFATETTNDELFQSQCNGAIQSVLRGISSTIFAYGQTGSGKTHTILGTQSEPGIVKLVASTLLLQLNLNSSPAAVSVQFSALQIYNNKPTDLIPTGKIKGGSTSTPPVPKVRWSSEHGVTIEHVTKHDLHCIESLDRLLIQMALHRKVCATELNDSSSRSHCICTFHIKLQSSKSVTDFETVLLHVVDLAGSERVKDSKVLGQNLTDAASINLSLFNLIQVVKTLVANDEVGKEKAVPKTQRMIVPYNNSLLTTLLRDSLGGRASTTVIACISPAQCHSLETLSTLGFAAGCSKVKNKLTNRSNVARLWNEKPNAQKAKPVKIKLPWESGCDSVALRRIELNTTVGLLSAITAGDSTKPLVLLLHGHPSDAESFCDWGIIPALVFAGYFVVALDMPGRGQSKAKPLKTRSEFNGDKNGACDVVLEVIKLLQPVAAIPKATLFGYDWGGGIALTMAHTKRYRRFVTHVIVSHPSYSEPEKGALLQCGCPVMVIWCKQDQFHSWTKWKALASSLESHLKKRFRLHLFSVTAKAATKDTWDTEEIERKVVEFLTGVDHGKSPQKIFSRATTDSTTTAGLKVTQQDNVVVLDSDILNDMKATIFASADEQAQAISEFKSTMKDQQLVQLYAVFCSAGKGKTRATQLFGNLPPISFQTISDDPHYLVRKGLWTALPSGMDAMLGSPRYFAGRRVLARLNVVATPSDPNYMAITNATAGKQCTTSRAIISSISSIDLEPSSNVKPSFNIKLTVDNDRDGKEEVTICCSQLLELNQPQLAPCVVGSPHELQLEDGIRCNYLKPLTKAKLTEIAIALAPIVEELDFDGDQATCQGLQIKAIHTVRRCLDILTFQRDNDGNVNGGRGVESRSRNRSRYCGDNAARFALFGQGHCHTVASIMYAFLHPFSRPLGLDIRYRGGESFDAVHRHTAVSDSPESHQWLEVTLRPSCCTVSVDLYREDGQRDRRGLHLSRPIEQSYRSELYPNGSLNKFCGLNVCAEDILSTDFLCA
eukprot:m.71809 g.71809  ORF g.71809 m.71809 type:complete len:1100 (-) comp24394_c0_seq3:172-3471(-)